MIDAKDFEPEDAKQTPGRRALLVTSLVVIATTIANPELSANGVGFLVFVSINYSEVVFLAMIATLAAAHWVYYVGSAQVDRYFNSLVHALLAAEYDGGDFRTRSRRVNALGGDFIRKLTRLLESTRYAIFLPDGEGRRGWRRFAEEVGTTDPQVEELGIGRVVARAAVGHWQYYSRKYAEENWKLWLGPVTYQVRSVGALRPLTLRQLLDGATVKQSPVATSWYVTIPVQLVWSLGDNDFNHPPERYSVSGELNWQEQLPRSFGAAYFALRRAVIFQDLEALNLFAPTLAARLAWLCVASEILAWMLAYLVLGTDPKPDGLIADTVKGAVLLASDLARLVSGSG